MNQQWLINHVLDTGDTIPKVPADDGRAYLSLAEAESIVDSTLDWLGAHADETEYTYMRGHRTRLMHALCMIPKGDQKHTTMLDVGCYGYMGLWAKQHLGYERVVGIEWHPENDAPIIERTLRVQDEEFSFESHNFDISRTEWPIEEQFDTVLFLEVLEHINEDPMGVMERINHRMKPDGVLAMSVPNAISYKALREFLVGMPPWTYWFYEPDLAHEPRHCFEYTPVVFRSLLTASGMDIQAMRTIFAYSTPQRERDTLDIAESLGFDPRDMGETMIAKCAKVREGVALRYPDVLYSPDGYYKNVYPRLQEILQRRIELHRAQRDMADSEAPINAQVETKPAPAGIESKPDTQAETLAEARGHIRELLETCEAHYQQQRELESNLEQAQSAQTQALLERDAHRDRTNELQAQNRELEAQVNQLLFQSDCQLQVEQDLRRKVEAAEQARLAHQQTIQQQLQDAQQQCESTHRELDETRTWGDRLSQENAELRAQVNELLFACDCYMQQLNDPHRCVQVIRQRRFRWALDRSKAVARKTPVVRTALRPVYRSAKRFIKRRI